MIQKMFSHIYLEKGLEVEASKFLKRFPDAILVPVSHYKNAFNSQKQDFRLQKLSPKLILAQKTSDFLYPGSHFSPSFGSENFYYNTLVLNCIYDCEYCYLQGMYPSANLVIFTNLDDFFRETKLKLTELGSLYLCISYDTDLLALEGVLGYCRKWIDFCQKEINLTIEIRTKSANFSAIKDLNPPKNCILAWTLSPNPVIQKWEKKTASLEHRIQSIKEALDFGWNVRLCIDPVLRYDGYAEDYENLIEKIHSNFEMERCTEICLGSFRMSGSYLKKMRDLLPKSAILHYPFQVKSGEARYPKEKHDELIDILQLKIKNLSPKAQIFVMD